MKQVLVYVRVYSFHPKAKHHMPQLATLSFDEIFDLTKSKVPRA